MSRNDYFSILNASPLPQILVGADEKIMAANPPASRLLGQGIVTRHYITGLRQPAVLDCFEYVLSGRALVSEAQYLAAEATRETTYRVVAARVEMDEAWGILVTFVDTTDLQEAGQMRRDFVANVSHELRSPLTALMGFIETLRGPARDDPAARDRFLGIMEREAGRMNRLVRDLLSLSRVESEERVQPQERVDVGEVLALVVSSLRPASDEAGMQVDVSTPAGPAYVRGDSDQLAQVVSNLLENAIKYGGGGSKVEIALSISPYESSLRGAAVVLEVADNGEGFDPVHIPRLTERFYRVDNHRSREMGGTGLGLAIVKHIISRHRGRLQIETEQRAGSRFTVMLPAAEAV
ncbi:MAG: ATP-binding protein [Pseudomonadota bacterium]